MSSARGTPVSQLPTLAIPIRTAPPVAASQLVMLALDVPPEAVAARVAQQPSLITRSAGDSNVTVKASQQVTLMLYSTGNPAVKRNRAWSFTLDGHVFYVLDLGKQGTFLYDQITNQWCNFSTQGFEPSWNFVNGCLWGNRTVGADAIGSQIWELIPTATLDEGWRDIAHIVTGGLSTRSRTFISCDAVRLACSIGVQDNVNGALIRLRYSDDQEATWSDYFTVDLTLDTFDGEIAYRSLGSFMSPGRIFEVSDSGGLIRIDGADAFLNGFDNDQQSQESK